MIKVHDSNDKLGIRFLETFMGERASDYRWEFFDLLYSGETFNGLYPSELEKLSVFGLALSREGFLLFEKTINYLTEGTVIARASSSKGDGCGGNIPLLEVLFYDGLYWEVGGEKAEEFISQAGLTLINEQE